MRTKPFGLLLALVMAFLVLATPLAAEEKVTDAKTDAKTSADKTSETPDPKHVARVEKYGQTYMVTLRELKERLAGHETKILERLNDDELLALAFVIEELARAELATKLEAKAKSAEASIPSLFNGMMVFSGALLLLALFSLLRVKTQAKKLAELEARINAMK